MDEVVTHYVWTVRLVPVPEGDPMTSSAASPPGSPGTVLTGTPVVPGTGWGPVIRPAPAPELPPAVPVETAEQQELELARTEPRGLPVDEVGLRAARQHVR